MSLTASQKLMKMMLVESETVDEDQLTTPEEIEEAWSDWGNEIEDDFREGDEETGEPCDWSRHYESKSVASKMLDGSWVGWTYWYGGGKHGEPEAIPWIEDAYDLDVTEEEKVVTVRTFKRKA